MNFIRWIRDTYTNLVLPDSTIDTIRKENKFPRRVAFIMDGNRTPMKGLAGVSDEYLIRQLSRNPDLAGYDISIQNGYYRVITPGGNEYKIDISFPGGLGYIAGYERMRQVVDLCLKYKIQVASFWGLSTDNIEKRPIAELRVIYQILEQETTRFAQEALEKGVKIELLGNREKIATLSTDGKQEGIILRSLEDAVRLTQENTTMKAAIVLAYGGRDEIVRAHRNGMMDIVQRSDYPRGASQDELEAYFKRVATEEGFAAQVESHKKLGDNDIIVRTGSGDAETVRTSGLFPWEDYSEIYQFPGSWLDFREREFRRMLIAFSRADRKFGGESTKTKK